MFVLQLFRPNKDTQMRYLPKCCTVPDGTVLLDRSTCGGCVCGVESQSSADQSSSGGGSSGVALHD